MTEQQGGSDGRADAPAGRQAANLARHLNAQHPSTVLLLARHGPGGSPDASRAELTAVDDHGITLRAASGDSTKELRLALPDGADLRSRVAALITAVRASLPDDGSVPLTSLEHQLRGH